MNSLVRFERSNVYVLLYGKFESFIFIDFSINKTLHYAMISRMASFTHGHLLKINYLRTSNLFHDNS